MADAVPEKVVLVIGETGNGKSSLINAMRGKQCLEEMGVAPVAEAGGNPNGTTKEMDAYECREDLVPGVKVTIYDSPGVGDASTPKGKLLAMYADTFDERGIDVVIVCTEVCRNWGDALRITSDLLHSGLVQTNADHKTSGNEGYKWKNVILVGTKADIVEWDPTDLDPWKEKNSVKFFEHAPGKVGPLAITGKRNPNGPARRGTVDISNLQEVLAEVPALQSGAMQREQLTTAPRMEKVVDQLQQDHAPDVEKGTWRNEYKETQETFKAARKTKAERALEFQKHFGGRPKEDVDQLMARYLNKTVSQLKDVAKERGIKQDGVVRLLAVKPRHFTHPACLCLEKSRVSPHDRAGRRAAARMACEMTSSGLSWSTTSSRARTRALRHSSPRAAFRRCSQRQSPLAAPRPPPRPHLPSRTSPPRRSRKSPRRVGCLAWLAKSRLGARRRARCGTRTSATLPTPPRRQSSTPPSLRRLRQPRR